MARQVEIHVTGLALCFIRQDVWYLIFVSDGVHALTLKDPDGNTTSLRRGTSALIGNFDGVRAADNTSVNFPHGRIPNLSDAFAHNANLTLDRTNTTTCILSIPLPGARLQTPGPDTQADCFIQEVKAGGGGRKKNLGKVSTKVVFRFQIQSNATNALTVTVTENQLGDVYNQRFPKAAGGGGLLFEFDNGCGNQCTHNDSIDLYDVIRDKGGDLKFVTGAALQNGNVPGHDPNNPHRPRPGGIGKLSPTYGNCDPVGSEPPPDGPFPPSLMLEGVSDRTASIAKDTAKTEVRRSVKAKSKTKTTAKPVRKTSAAKPKTKAGSNAKPRNKTKANGKAKTKTKTKP